MTTGSDFGSFETWLILTGVAQSMLLVPLLVRIIGSVKPQDAPKASSFISLAVQLGGSIGSSLLITIFDRRTFFHSDAYAATATLANSAIRRFFELGGTRAELSHVIGVQALNAGFADAMFVIAPIAGLAAVMALLLRRSPSTSA
jgi:hypothetical protein